MSELKKLISRGESINLDFKFRIDDQKKIARTLCAFANTEGGKLLIGVKDNGKITGIEPSEEFHMIQGAAEMFCRPPVKFESRIWQEDHKLVMEIDVPKNEIVKHKAPDEHGDFKIFVRVHDETILANKILIDYWRYQKQHIARPELFDAPQLELLQLIQEHQPVSLSRLYKLSSLRYRDVDRLLVLFICWNLVKMNLGETKCTFEVK